MTRLLKHIRQVNCSKVICKHCEQNFNFKNQFHDHIREQHIKSNFRFFTSKFTYKIKKKSTVICSSVSLASSIFSATFTSISESISSKCSSFPIATHRITSKSMKKLSVNSFTFSIFSFRKSVSKHQKSYFTIDDLIRMFREKSKSSDLHTHQKDFVSSQRFDIRSSRQSRFFSMHQSRIIFYFMFAINQKASINQDLKSSNSKNFQQHTFAKSISFCRFVLSEKSIISSYKKSNIFYISLQSRFSSRFSFLQSRFSFA